MLARRNTLYRLNNGDTVLILTGDYHTHSPYSHGKSTIMENAVRAKELGLKEIAITDHGYTHVAFGLKRKETQDYIKECKDAQDKFGVRVLVGIEANILGVEGRSDLSERDFENFDVYLAGNHIAVKYAGWKNFWGYGLANIVPRKLKMKPSDALIQRNTNAYINTIKNNPLDAVTHLNFLCPSNTLEVAKCAEDYGTYIELNSKKQHLTDEELCEIAQKTNVRFIINSDAHGAHRVGDTASVEQQLSRIDFPLDRIDNIEGRTPNFRFTQFKKGM